jgi:small subunit ribosomal protein S2
MNIPVVAIVDTNVDPTEVDFPIPANDDAAKSISLITSKIADVILEAKQKANENKALKEAAEQEKEQAGPAAKAKQERKPRVKKESK